jgi:hypothetical protein
VVLSAGYGARLFFAVAVTRDRAARDGLLGALRVLVGWLYVRGGILLRTLAAFGAEDRNDLVDPLE